MLLRHFLMFAGHSLHCGTASDNDNKTSLWVNSEMWAQILDTARKNSTHQNPAAQRQQFIKGTTPYYPFWRAIFWHQAAHFEGVCPGCWFGCVRTAKKTPKTLQGMNGWFETISLHQSANVAFTYVNVKLKRRGNAPLLWKNQSRSKYPSSFHSWGLKSPTTYWTYLLKK